MADRAWFQEEKRDPVAAAGRFGMTATTKRKERKKKKEQRNKAGCYIRKSPPGKDLEENLKTEIMEL